MPEAITETEPNSEPMARRSRRLRRPSLSIQSKLLVMLLVVSLVASIVVGVIG